MTVVPHHADPWHRCRTTSLDDTVLLCDQTHSQLHSGTTIRLKDGRRLGPHGWITDTTPSASGRRIAAQPPG